MHSILSFRGSATSSWKTRPPDTSVASKPRTSFAALSIVEDLGQRLLALRESPPNPALLAPQLRLSPHRAHTMTNSKSSPYSQAQHIPTRDADWPWRRKPETPTKFYLRPFLHLVTAHQNLFQLGPIRNSRLLRSTVPYRILISMKDSLSTLRC